MVKKLAKMTWTGATTWRMDSDAAKAVAKVATVGGATRQMTRIPDAARTRAQVPVRDKADELAIPAAHRLSLRLAEPTRCQVSDIAYSQDLHDS